MIDRWGRPIRVGWPEHHILWLRAAMTLEPDEMRDAFLDIAELTGRSLASVRSQAGQLREIDRRDDRRRRLCQLAERWAAE